MEPIRTAYECGQRHVELMSGFMDFEGLTADMKAAAKAKASGAAAILDDLSARFPGVLPKYPRLRPNSGGGGWKAECGVRDRELRPRGLSILAFTLVRQATPSEYSFGEVKGSWLEREGSLAPVRGTPVHLSLSRAGPFLRRQAHDRHVECLPRAE